MSSDAAHVSSLPLPPLQFVNLYSEDNMRRGKTPRPPPPIHESYTMFGNEFHAEDVIIRPLENQGIRRLYPQHFDHKRELRKLNHSALASFLDLLDILIRCPDYPRREEKMEDLQLLLVHMHHLVNEIRPHQARETLRVTLELQKRQRLETSDRFQRHLERAVEVLQSALQALPDSMDTSSGVNDSVLNTGDGDKLKESSSDDESCSRLDRIMCDIVDAL